MQTVGVSAALTYRFEHRLMCEQSGLVSNNVLVTSDLSHACYIVGLLWNFVLRPTHTATIPM
jgi:hypothetical protein